MYTTNDTCERGTVNYSRSDGKTFDDRWYSRQRIAARNRASTSSLSDLRNRSEK